MKDGHSVGVAFALCIGAGLATVLGGMVVFSKRLVNMANPFSLAIALSLSAGVMIFISLVEIFNKSQQAMLKALRTPSMTTKTASGHAWLAATLCFTGGIALVYAVDLVVHKIAPDAHEATELDNLGTLRQSFREMDEAPRATFVEAQTPDPMVVVKVPEAQRIALQRMGILSAIAIGLHNLPEGVATYASAIQDSSVGISLAVGIGIHNIPEGIAVASPIYFATGSRCRALLWCTLSAMVEPFGGFLGWAAFGDGLSPTAEGILFGFVCGIMTCICIKELWPTAIRFSGDRPHIVAIGTFAGMIIMALSLVLFGYAGV